MSKNITLNGLLNRSYFNTFINKLQDICKIDDKFMMRINKDKVFFYCAKSSGNTAESIVLALKSYTISTSDIFEKIDIEDDGWYDVVVLDAVKFIKNLSFLNLDKPIKISMIYRKDYNGNNHIRSLIISNDKLKISLIGGEHNIIRVVSEESLRKRLLPSNADFSFSISNEDFSSIKSMSSIYSENNVIWIEVRGGKVYATEPSKWELHIDDIDYKDTKVIFGKKFLKSVTSEKIDFYVFETFLLVKDNESNFMMSFEQSFDDE